jgi:hypothetical protein
MKDSQYLALAAVACRREALNHPCAAAGRNPWDAPGGGCLHVHHRRDISYLARLLEIVDLPETLPELTPADYR